MKYSSVITLCLISFILSSKPLGSWEPDTFARDDLYLDRSRSLAEKEYLKVTNANEDFFITKIANPKKWLYLPKFRYDQI